MNPIHLRATRRSVLVAAISSAISVAARQAGAADLPPRIRLVEPFAAGAQGSTIELPRTAQVRLLFEAAAGARIDLPSLRVSGAKLGITQDITGHVRDHTEVSEKGIYIASVDKLRIPYETFTLKVKIADTAGRQTEWVGNIRLV
jgi:hypothetical protein